MSEDLYSQFVTPTGATTAPSPKAGDEDAIALLMAEVAELEEDHQLRELQAASAPTTEGRKSGGPKGTAADASSGAGPNSIFISNLDPRTSDADLRAVFSSCGTIVRVTILRDRVTQVPRGLAYIEFDSADAASKGLAKENQSLHGKPMKVMIKRDNVPAHLRGGVTPPFGFAPTRGATRGGRGAAQLNNPQAMLMGMMQMMTATMQQTAAPRGGRGRGTFRGAPRGRGQ